MMWTGVVEKEQSDNIISLEKDIKKITRTLFVTFVSLKKKNLIWKDLQYYDFIINS